VNFSGHYLNGELYSHDKENLVCKFRYALIKSKNRYRDTYLQGVSSNQVNLTIEIVSNSGVFQREMYVKLQNGVKYMIETIISENPLNALNPKTKYFVQMELKE
jgi:hypothetical protein